MPFAGVLYGNDAVMQSFYDSLSDEGILVMQLGESSSLVDPAEILGSFENRAKTTELLTRVGFQSIHAYEEVSTIILYRYLFYFLLPHAHRFVCSTWP